MFYISTKAQTWYADFVIGIFIFMVTIVLYYSFVPNLEKQEVEGLRETYYEAKILSDSLVSTGHPDNWTVQDVQRIGLKGSNGINLTKLVNFRNISYYKTKEYLNLRSDYAIVFYDLNNTLLNISNHTITGHLSASAKGLGVDIGEDYTDLVSITRVQLYNKSIVKMVVYVWR